MLRRTSWVPTGSRQQIGVEGTECPDNLQRLVGKTATVEVGKARNEFERV